MASYITVRDTRENIIKAFDAEDKDITVKYFQYVGINEKGDKEYEDMTEKEWDDLRTVPCLFEVEVRHNHFPKLRERDGFVYSSWKSVVRALRRKKKIYIEGGKEFTSDGKKYKYENGNLAYAD